MSVVVRNGKAQLEAKPKGIDAPTPSQIAERAYDLAAAEAVQEIARWTRAGAPVDPGIVRAFLAESKARVLDALRTSVINPDAIPWWRK